MDKEDLHVLIDLDLKRFDELWENGPSDVRKKEFPHLDKEEIYGYIVNCPNCKNRAIFLDYNYCPICGIKITFSQRVLDHFKDDCVVS